MRLYYRADTRSPQTIFQHGFSKNNAPYSLNQSDWWQPGIRNNATGFFLKTSATDADMRNVVCLSTKFESAPLFPICDQYHADYDSEIYIYVMALPDAELPNDLNIPQNIDVFDMHAFQLQEFEAIMNDSTLSVNPAMAGYVLSGHEAFAKKVLTQNIICAVKCKRSDYVATAGLPVYARAKDDAAKFAPDQARYFEIGHEIFENKHYLQAARYKNLAIETLREIKAKGLQPTASVQDALDESGIAYDKKQIHTSTYIWQELTSFHFGMAFFSVLESIYYAAIQLSKCMMNKSEQKPIEIIATLPDPMPNLPKDKSMSFYGRYFTTIGLVTGEANPTEAYMIKNSSLIGSAP